MSTWLHDGNYWNVVNIKLCTCYNSTATYNCKNNSAYYKSYSCTHHKGNYSTNNCKNNSTTHHKSNHSADNCKNYSPTHSTSHPKR